MSKRIEQVKILEKSADGKVSRVEANYVGEAPFVIDDPELAEGFLVMFIGSIFDMQPATLR